MAPMDMLVRRRPEPRWARRPPGSYSCGFSCRLMESTRRSRSSCSCLSTRAISSGTADTGRPLDEPGRLSGAPSCGLRAAVEVAPAGSSSPGTTNVAVSVWRRARVGVAGPAPTPEGPASSLCGDIDAEPGSCWGAYWAPLEEWPSTVGLQGLLMLVSKLPARLMLRLGLVGRSPGDESAGPPARLLDSADPMPRTGLPKSDCPPMLRSVRCETPPAAPAW
mmetsp:Transcript_11203/g.27485  ORF Transcript_11203/g.27485 Transcript_11203/m.27485 type:complete len:221 (+) Transcript_11203:561-1223(+)